MENATPINFEITMKRNVREQKIRERGVNHENHENIMPRKFGAIRYSIVLSNGLPHSKLWRRTSVKAEARMRYVDLSSVHASTPCI